MTPLHLSTWVLFPISWDLVGYNVCENCIHVTTDIAGKQINDSLSIKLKEYMYNQDESWMHFGLPVAGLLVSLLTKPQMMWNSFFSLPVLMILFCTLFFPFNSKAYLVW